MILMAGLFLFSSLMLVGQTSKYALREKKDKNGDTYQYVTNDPMETRIYTLENGLKVFISPNDEESRIQTMIGIHAGSAVEPVESTGLAHYLEHMLFKGTSKIGAMNWEKEKPLLDQISALFEQHRNTTDEDQKKLIYQRIDSLSTLASQYVAPNEYSKLTSALGASGLNAATSYDFTYYRQNIPSNELERWAELESERINNVVLRLFHTELETVYEEYNRAQDNDSRQIFYAMLDNLFEHHPYKRPVLGFPEHLKNPSMVNIHAFFDTYYVPNNMIMVLTGLVNPEEAMPVVKKYFGGEKPGQLPETAFENELPIVQPKNTEIFSPEEEKLILAYRLMGKNSDDYKYSLIIDGLLSNSGETGLFDTGLNKNGEVHSVGSSLLSLKDYGVHYFMGIPKEGQSLEQVEELIRSELEKIKRGEFDAWLIEAVVNNLKKSRITSRESNVLRANAVIFSEMYGMPYEKYVSLPDELMAITKEEIIDFARRNYHQNYITVYKRKGEKTLKTVDKPAITPLKLNNSNESQYAKDFINRQTNPIQPEFVDYKKEFPGQEFSNGMDFYYQNDSNGLFSFRYIIPVGNEHDTLLPFAIHYFKELGTPVYSPDNLKNVLYRYGISFNLSASDDKTYLNLTGLDEHFEKALALVEHLFSEVQNDPEIYRTLIEKEEGNRKLIKNNQRSINAYAQQYILYGPENSYTNSPSVETLKEQDPAALLDKVKSLFDYNHIIYYSGGRTKEEVMDHVAAVHALPEKFAVVPDKNMFTYRPLNKPVVYFLDYDMVQAQVNLIMKNDVSYSPELLAFKDVYDNYYGVGLGSVIFQEIRESRALAYSSGSYYQMEVTTEADNVVVGYVGTQPDKLAEALHAMEGLLDTMKYDPQKFEIARASAIKALESERIPRKYWFGRYMGLIDKGIDYDVREDHYKDLKKMTPDKFQEMFGRYIHNPNKQLFIQSKKENIDFELLKQFGEVREITLEDIFGY